MAIQAASAAMSKSLRNRGPTMIKSMRRVSVIESSSRRAQSTEHTEHFSF